jgi:hypothetical protein
MRVVVIKTDIQWNCFANSRKRSDYIHFFSLSSASSVFSRLPKAVNLK